MSTNPPIIPNFGGGGGVWDETTAAALVLRYTANGRQIVPVDTLNRTSRRARQSQATVAGANSLLPLIYGTRRVGARVGAIVPYGEKLVVLAAWCSGEVNSVGTLLIDDKTLEGGIVATNYTGTSSQTADPTLIAAYAAAGKSYTDALPGVAYTVYSFPPRKSAGFPRMTALIGGLKIRTTSGGARSYQDNAAYIIADFIESTTYGMGRSVDWATVATLAAACDASVGGERKRILNLALDSQQPGETWLTVLRDYAGCWIVPEGAAYRLIPDVVGSSIYSFTAANIVAGTLKLDKRGSSQTPTCVEVTYTDQTQNPWRDAPVTVYAAGVLAGTTPRRMSRISKPGITRHSEAYRYAVERLNESMLNDLSVSFVCFDVGLTIQVGDLIDVTHPIGLTAKVFRVVRAEPVGGGGRWAISGVEYDAAKYSSDVVAGPSSSDTSLASPLNPPVPTGLSAVEDVYQDATGLYASRFAVSWTAVDTTYPFASGYVVRITQAGVLKDAATVSSGSAYLSKALTENLSYVVSVAVLTTLDVVGTAASTTLSNTGKSAKPTDVPSITGYEVAGELRLQWTPATDLDLTAHELRYSTTGGSWAAATLLDRVAAPSVRYTTKVIPAGTWRIWIKGLDSLRSVTYPYGQESVNAAYVDVAVTSDANAFLAGEYSFVTATTLTNMSAQRDGAGTVYWVTDDAITWSARLTANLSTYTNAVWTYFSTLTSTFGTDHHDFASSITGTWTGTVSYTDIAGTATKSLDLSLTDSGYTSNATLTAAVTARWAKAASTSTGTLRINALGDVKVVTVGRQETGSFTSSNVADTTVNLTGTYTKRVSLQITPSGAVFCVPFETSVSMNPASPNSFTAKCVDIANARVNAVVCTYTFQGV